MVTPGQLSAAVAVPSSLSVTSVVMPVAARITFAGAVRVGRVLSTTVTSCVPVAWFPAPSVALKVSVVVPTGKMPGGAPPTRVTLTIPELSTAVASPSVAVSMNAPQTAAPAPVYTVTFAGTVSTGAVSSITVTVCAAVAVLPLASMARNVFVVVPIGMRLPTGRPLMRLTITPEQLSEAVAKPRSEMTRPGSVEPGPVPRVMLGGAVISGGVLSTTVTVSVAVAAAPSVSVAVYVIVVLPTGKRLPLGTPARVIVTAPGAPLVATAVPSAASLTKTPHAVAPAPVKTVTSDGVEVNVGGAVRRSNPITTGSWSDERYAVGA